MVIVKEGMSDWPGNDGEMTSRSNSRLTFEGIKVRDFFEKNMEKKHLSCHDKNYYYFCKSNIPVINLIASFRILESAMDKQEVKCDAKLSPVCFSVTVSKVAVVFCQQILKNRQFCLKLSVFWNLSAKYKS